MLAGSTRQAQVVFDFLVAEDLNPAGMDEVKVADLVGCRGGIARYASFAAGETGEPAELQWFAVIVIQLLDGQQCARGHWAESGGQSRQAVQAWLPGDDTGVRRSGIGSR